MKHELDWVLAECRRLIERDANLRLKQAAMDRHDQLDYQPPPELAALDWWRPVIPTAPRDALEGGTRALTAMDERITLEPYSVLDACPPGTLPDEPVARAKANAWERALKWEMDRAVRRRGNLRQEVVRSALKYDEICGQVVYLPAQVKALESLGVRSARHQAALRQGNFTILLKNPQSVHAVFSPYMLEAVACIELWTGRELKLFFGERAGDVDDGDTFMLCDYHSLEERHLFFVAGETENVLLDHSTEQGQVVYRYTDETSDRLVVILSEENKLPFLPWVVKAGGSDLEALPENQRRPLLDAIYLAETWLVATIVQSIEASKQIAQLSEPRLIVSGPSPNTIEVDHTDPTGRVNEPPGHQVQVVPPSPLDIKGWNVADRMEAAMATSTVSRILVTGDAQPGESFSGYNLRVKTAIGALLRFKDLAEQFFAGLYETMLLSVKYHGGKLSGYGPLDDKQQIGKYYAIPAADINPATINLRVALTAELPIDRLQAINGAAIAKQQLGLSNSTALEMIGVTDAEREQERALFEQFDLAELKGRLARIEAEAAGQYEQDVLQAAQAMLEQQMAQQPPPMEQPPMGGGLPPEMMGGYGMPAPGDGALVPALGGLPFAQSNPAGNVREQVNGADRMGAELA